MDNNFEQFLLKVLENSPGHCANVFRKFIGPVGQEVSFIGAFENLVDDLVKGLTSAGLSISQIAWMYVPVMGLWGFGAWRLGQIYTRMKSAVAEKPGG